MKLLFATSLLSLSYVAVGALKSKPPLLGLCEYDCDVDADCKPGLLCADAHKPELKAKGFDERKANCGKVGAWNLEVCFDPAILNPSGGGGGDPHFRTYDGTKYDYHGQCDLVMARSTSFGAGLGLELHARTEIVAGWSLISNAALQIGKDIVELANDGSIYFNSKALDDITITMAGKYKVSKTVETLGETSSNEQITVTVDLGNDQNIRMTLFKKMISVQVNASLLDTEGMLGNQGISGMIGRERTVVHDANEMGAQWQVTDVEPMLFREIRAPQYPERCILPEVDGRRLAHSDESQKVAVAACASVAEALREFCLADVLLTGDVELASGYSF